MFRPRFWIALSALAACLLQPPPSLARVKLITLPKRDRVEIQLDHANVTLVEEERVVPLNQGVNQVDFAWAQASIDKDTVQFRPLEGGERVKVLSVSYPPNENALVWQVAAAEAGPAKVRISYIIGQLDKSFEYRATAAHDEKTLALSQYIRLQNLSNEEYGDAGLWAGFGDHFLRPIGINETKQILSARFADVPIQKTYTCDPAEFGYLVPEQKQLRVPMHYVLRNDAAHKLGQFPLRYGKARIFQEDGKGGVAFVGEDWGKFTPIDDEMRLYLGQAKDIVVRRTIDRSERERLGGDLANLDVVIKYEIENFKPDPVVLDLAESLVFVRNEIRGDSKCEPQWDLAPDSTVADMLDKSKTTSDRVLFHVPLPARAPDGKAEKTIHRLHIVIKNEAGL